MKTRTLMWLLSHETLKFYLFKITHSQSFVFCISFWDLLWGWKFCICSLKMKKNLFKSAVSFIFVQGINWRPSTNVGDKFLLMTFWIFKLSCIATFIMLHLLTWHWWYYWKSSFVWFCFLKMWTGNLFAFEKDNKV